MTCQLPDWCDDYKPDQGRTSSSASSFDSSFVLTLPPTVSEHRRALPYAVWRAVVSEGVTRSLHCGGRWSCSCATMRATARRGRRIIIVSVLLLLFCSTRGISATDGLIGGKLSGIIIPGFASTQLRAWSVLDCPYSPLDFNPLDLVWLDTTKVWFCSSPSISCLGTNTSTGHDVECFI